MKLRLRSLDSKETVKLEVPNTCTILDLKAILSFEISNGASSSFIPPEQLFLTLNRKDELSGSSLQSLGVTSGDLIFYSPNPNPNHDESSSPTVNFEKQIDDNLQKLGSDTALGVESKNMVDDRSLELNLGDCMTGELTGSPQVAEKETLESLTSRKRPNVPEISGGEVEGVEDMEVDDGDDANLRSLSVPSLLQMLLENEIGTSSSTNNSDNRLLNVGVHAVLLESGFVGYDPSSCTKLDWFRPPSSSMHYTVFQLLSSHPVPTVAIKFQNLGKFVNVNASLNNKFIYRVCLDVSRFAPAFRSVCMDAKAAGDLMLKNPESDIFEFWKHVKDGIALPLLIDLCESVGLVPPSSLMVLPTELKLKILELLPGTDTAKVGCACKELRFITSNNTIWRQKYKEEFGNAGKIDSECSWKLKFARDWSNWKKKKAETGSFCRTRLYGFRPPRVLFRDPVPFGIPRIIGDYDLPPGMIPNPFGRRRMPTHPNFNLGGF